MKSLKIASITSEVDPYSKSGGLGDVARSLPKALKRLGNEIIIITPLYEKIIDTKKFNIKPIAKNIELLVSEGIKVKVDFLKTDIMKGLSVYFVANKEHFAKRKTLYGSRHENSRFMLFDLAALELLKFINFSPEIIQCHDWQTGLIPYFLKGRFKNEQFFKKTATVFTIHNLVFQMGKNWWEVRNGNKDDGYRKLPPFHSEKLENINLAKRAIINADLINTVSEQYAEEILTKDFGEDLHRILKNRKDKLFGIINGIDYNEYNPQKDPGLAKNYDSNSINKKVYNKEALQKLFKLPQDKKIPVIGMTSRIAEQKGFEILLDMIDFLMRHKVQLLIMGDGDKNLIKKIQKKVKKYPRRISYMPFNKHKETLTYAGADLFLGPSRFEPCGINQLISLRYGCIPITRAIGGLADTVTNFNPQTGKGNGFNFKYYNPIDLLMATVRALETYKYKDVWKNMVEKSMKQSFSWEIPAQKYIVLFKKAIQNKNGY